MQKNLSREILGKKRVILANAVRASGGSGYNTYCLLYLHGERDLIASYFPSFDFVGQGQGYFRDFPDQESLLGFLTKKGFTANGKGCFVKLI